MPIDVRPGEKVLVLGDYEAGKSTLSRALLEAQSAPVVYDTIWEFGDLARDGRGVVVRDLRSLGDAVQRVREPGFARVVFQPPKAKAGDRALLEAFLEVVMRSRNRMVAVDEMHVFFEDGNKTCPPALSHFLRFGHKAAFGRNGIVMISHRAVDLPPQCRFGLRHLFAFHDELPLDVKTLRDLIGEVADELPRLPAHHFVHKTFGANGEVRRYGPLEVD